MFFLTTPFVFSLIQRLSDFQSNKFVSRFSSAEEVHFVINSEICSLFGLLGICVVFLSEKKNYKLIIYFDFSRMTL